MDDLYLDQMVKRGKEQKDRMMRVLLIICGLIVISIPFVVSLAFSYLVTPVIVMAVALVVWIMWRRVSKEYEYIFINGNLDIDVIYGRSTRRHLVTFDCRLCRMIVPADDPKAKKEEEKKHDQTIMAIPDKPDSGTYVIAGQDADKQYLVYFQPNDRLLNAIAEYSPKNTVIRRRIEEAEAE